MKPELPIAVLGEESFRYGLTVLMRSIADLEANRHAKFFVLDLNLKPATREVIRRFGSEAFQDGAVTFLDPKKSTLFQQMRGASWSFYRYCCMSKFALLDLLSQELNTILYLDSDIYCAMDLSTLPGLTNGHPLSAVVDRASVAAGGAWEYAVAGIAPTRPYFNAGMMHLDLAPWRTPAFRDRALSSFRLLDGNGDPRFTDQSVMNLLYCDTWNPLAGEWNWQCPYTYGIGNEITQGRKFNLHYLANPKPWHRGEDRSSQFFYDALDRTPYRNWRPNALFAKSIELLRLYKCRLSQFASKLRA